jgi:hypothetical protein
MAEPSEEWVAAHKTELLAEYAREYPQFAAFLAYDEAMGNDPHYELADLGEGFEPVMALETMKRFAVWVGTSQALRFKAALDELGKGS